MIAPFAGIEWSGVVRIVQPDSGAIRAANRASVVNVLRRAGSATRVELMARTGLSRATVSSLISDLRLRGLISERPGPPSDGLGRPPSVLALNRSAGLAIAVDVGVRHVAVAVGDLSRCVLAERWISLPHGHDAGQGVATVLRCIDEAMDEAEADPDQLVGAAISMAAPVASPSGRLPVPGVLPGWSGEELATPVGERWQIPVVVENDANLGALAECAWGEFAGTPNLLYVKVASRVGLGVVINGSIYHGRGGFAGELGHLTAERDGPLCWCGRHGCLELYVGAEGLIGQLAGRGTEVRDLTDLITRAERGVPGVLEVVGRAARVLADGLAALALLFDPVAIVVGGELAALGERLLAPARAELAAVPFGPPVTIAHSSLGDRASMVGALALVLTETSRFTDRSAAVAAAPA
jgi:predicted NBD/HSP70 family sugar kinase